MKTDVVVPIRNAIQYLPALCDVLVQLDSQRYRVLFFDSESADGSAEYVVKRGFALHIIAAADFDHGGTRALVGKLCAGELAVFLTQDALPVGAVDIDRIVVTFDDARLAAAYGRQLPHRDASLFARHLRAFNYPVDSHWRTLDDRDRIGFKAGFLSNSFSAYRRSAMDEIGWFKDGLILGEDAYAGAKLLAAGYKLAYVADAEVYHSHNYSVWQEFQRYFDIGVFHCLESWLLEEFGKPEGEGVRYLRSELAYISRTRAYYLIPEFLVRNAMKYTGYLLGRHFKRLPKILLRKLSMHRRWWDQYFTV